MDSSKINQMLAAANGANHVGEYPVNCYSSMANKVGTIHAVCDLQEILQLRAQVEQLREENTKLWGWYNTAEQRIAKQIRTEKQ